MVVEQAMQRVRVQQGHVRGDDQHLAVVLELAIQLVHGALDRTPRAWSAVLAHDAHLGIVGPCSLRHQVGLMMNHHCRQLGIQSSHRGHDPLQKGLSGQGVQNLGMGRAHADTLACGQDDASGQRLHPAQNSTTPLSAMSIRS